ncbi:MAG TPA: hypothetical protein VG276_18615 [Actinomycetes bacterium]|nr:hypothetical protein [Actinomycetes bacterium]
MATSTTTDMQSRAGLGKGILRRDAWWLPPLVTVVVLAGFVVYGTWVAFIGRDYYADPYLSPFYSPCLAANCEHATWQLVGDWWKLSPALLVLPFPLAFRLTCYYYRKAYYRSFWWAPPACAVPDARARYTGETRFPLILQNVHRYFFYLALPFPLILTFDALRAFSFPDGFGMGVGTLVLLANAALLWLYTLSCHSCRHLCGGHVNVFSKAPVRFWLWRKVSALNARHMLYAWVSLFVVALTDLYVWLVATGAIRDLRFF